MCMIDQIIDFNKEFVAQKGYEKYLTDKYHDKKLAVLSCMDTRLTELLPAALGLKTHSTPSASVVLISTNGWKDLRTHLHLFVRQ